MNIDSPWKLCSNELDREFQILDVNDTPIAKVLLVKSSLVAPWNNKKLTAKQLWHQLANVPERTKTQLMVEAPEMYNLLRGPVHRFLRKNGYDMTQIDAILNRIENH